MIGYPETVRRRLRDRSRLGIMEFRDGTTDPPHGVRNGRSGGRPPSHRARSGAVRSEIPARVPRRPGRPREGDGQPTWSRHGAL